MSNGHLGLKHTQETKNKMRLSAIKRGPVGCCVKGRKKPDGYGKRMSEIQKGRRFTEEHKRKLKVARAKQVRPKGEDAWNWKGCITPMNDILRMSDESILWRKSVFERDKYTCQKCGQIGGELNSHHIIPFSVFPEGRFALNNGKTLCKNCHQQTNSFGGRMTHNKKWVIIEVNRSLV